MTIIDQNKELLCELYKRGFVSSTTFTHNEIYKDYLETKDVAQTAANFNIGRDMVYKVIAKFK